MADELIQAGRDSEALKVLDDALAQALGPKPAFSDVEDRIMWVQNARSNALSHLGRFDDAVAAMRAGMEHQEGGEANISQAVNLAELLNRLGRPKEALEVIARAGPGSPIGQLEVAEAKVSAYAQLGQRDKVVQLLADARTHVTDDPSAVEEMLFDVGDLDGAAALYVQRLNDPAMRDRVLMDLQIWLRDGATTPEDVEREHRFEAVRARPDVQAAVKAVGRIETIPFRDN